MKAGTIVTTNFPGVVSAKRRPAVVVSSETYQKERPDLILALVTTNVSAAASATDCVLQDWSAANLNRPSAVRMFLFTLPEREVKEIGKLSERDWTQVQERPRVSLEI